MKALGKILAADLSMALQVESNAYLGQPYVYAVSEGNTHRWE